MSNRIVHFEIHANEPERAAEFYKKVFGWEITKWDSPEMEYWMVMTAPKDSTEPGINGGMIRRKDCDPVTEKQAVNAFVCTMLVENIDVTAEAIVKAGGTLALPRFAIANMAWQAYYKDTEGNIFGIHQPMANTK
jgi:predicted enzyme related to lactoylglutathione lyase